MTRHLIIGGGPAAINAVETIRDIDSDASSITLVCDEPAYSRMVLPYYLADRIPRQQVFTGDDAYFDRLKVDRVFGSQAERVQRHADGGTRKESSSRAGAFEKTSSSGSDGRGSSARRTLTTSSGCDVDKTSLRSSSDTLPTASRIAFS